MTTVARILELARTLSSSERASVARDLLATLDYPGEPLTDVEADEAWRAEVRARATRILLGEAVGVESDALHADIEHNLKRV